MYVIDKKEIVENNKATVATDNGLYEKKDIFSFTRVDRYSGIRE